MNFWAPNISTIGRLIRAAFGALFLTSAVICLLLNGPLWAGLALGGLGLVCLSEAVGGWCLARACGIKTPW